MSEWDLRLGDCLDPVSGLATLADRSVDHFVTDPPYSRDLYLSFRTNKGARGREAKQTDAHLALSSFRIGAIDDILENVAAQMARAGRRWVVAFHDAEIGHRWRMAFGEAFVRSGVWVKGNPVPQISGDRPGQGFESITIAHRSGAKRWNGGGKCAVWTCNAENSQSVLRAAGDHPCPKPLALMEQLIADFTDPGELVCDPFAGSGTTGVACIRLGRRFIGWEKDPSYYETARKRLSAARQQYELLARGPKPRQAKFGLSDPEAA